MTSTLFMTSSTSSSSSSESDSSSTRESRKRRRGEDCPEFESDCDVDSNQSNEDEPVPPISHAERRRQKKKAKREETLGDQKHTNKKKQTNDSGVSGLPPRQNSVWVGNLSFKTTPEALRSFFEGCGEITRIHLPMKASTPGTKSENRG